MQIDPGLRQLMAKVANHRDWLAEKEALRDELTAETKGATLPALVAFTESLATARRELDATAGAEGVEALDRLAVAIEDLGDAPERESYVRPYNAALRALEHRVRDDGPVLGAINATLPLIEPAEREADAEIARRRRAAAEKEAREREAKERREAEERKRKARAQADAARTALAEAFPEVEAALAPETAQAA